MLRPPMPRRGCAPFWKKDRPGGATDEPRCSGEVPSPDFFWMRDVRTASWKWIRQGGRAGKGAFSPRLSSPGLSFSRTGFGWWRNGEGGTLPPTRSGVAGGVTAAKEEVGALVQASIGWLRHRRCQAIRGGRHVCRVWKACPAFGRTLFNDHPKRLITIPAINRLNGCCIVWLPA